MDHRALARITAAGRVAIGAALLVAPRRVAGGWVGDAGGTPGGKLLGRALGARDLVLGLGIIDALDRGDAGASSWVRAGAFADTADAVATVLAFRHLPRRARFGVLVLAAGAAVVGHVAAENLE